jgi:hypothetical protein
VLTLGRIHGRGVESGVEVHGEVRSFATWEEALGAVGLRE